MNGEFTWEMAEDDFIRCKEEKGEVEDDIYGFVFYRTDKNRYMVDIHYEYYNSRDCGFDLEFYTERPEGGHWHWLGSSKEIKSAVNFRLFQTRAEKEIAKWIDALES